MKRNPALLATVAMGCVYLVSIAQASPILKLPSGKQVRVINAGPVFSTNGKRLGLEFQYETELKVSDLDSLRREANEVFSAIRSDAERGKETSVIVSAVEKSQGFVVTKSKGYNFVFEKNNDGTWHCLSDAPKGVEKKDKGQ